MVQQMTARERILTLHAQGKSPELIASEVFTTIEHVMNVIVTAPDAALTTAQPVVDSPMELATSLLVDYELERQQLTLERDRLKQDCANLLAACQQAQRFLWDLGPIRHDGTHNLMLALARELTKAINDCETP